MIVIDAAALIDAVDGKASVIERLDGADMHAPHLIDKLSLIIPVYEDSRRGMFIIRLGMIAYEIPSLDLSGEVPIERIALDNVALCESLGR